MLPSRRLRRYDSPAPRSLGSIQNGILLTELWQKRWSGTLQLLEGDRSDWITLESGGPVCAEDSLLLCRAMQGGGMLVTRTCLVDSSGSRESMARLLLWCARSRNTDFVEKNLRRFVLAAPGGLQLPIRPDTRRFLQAADGSQRVSELCEQLNLSGTVISPELAALYRLHLVDFVQPTVSFRPLSLR